MRPKAESSIANQESFHLLGFEIGMKVAPELADSFPYIRPSRKAQQALRMLGETGPNTDQRGTVARRP